MKVAICVPVHGDVKAGFAASLALLFGYETRRGTDLSLTMVHGHLPDVRNDIAAAAVKAGAGWLLWLDADQTFPQETLERLLAHRLDLVGCNYPRRLGGPGPTAVKNGQPLCTTQALARARIVDDADGMGMGVCLVRASAFDALDRPWFTIERKEDGSGHVSEDVLFFRRLRNAGFAAHVDHALSWEVGHIAEHTLVNAQLGRGYVSTILPSAGAQ